MSSRNESWIPDTHRRVEVRKPVRLPVEVIPPYGDRSLSLFATDLSSAGLFVQGVAAVLPGDPIVVAFRLPGDAREIVLFGEVARVPEMPDRGDADPLGFGVRFLDATPWERLRIRAALGPVPPAMRRRREAGPVAATG
jgi:Tfp pilus assembly protein PilZ